MRNNARAERPAGAHHALLQLGGYTMTLDAIHKCAILRVRCLLVFQNKLNSIETGSHFFTKAARSQFSNRNENFM